MKNVYFDTEFTCLYGMTEPTRLISAGFVAEDGREHYFELIGHYNETECTNFVRETVLAHLNHEKYGKDPKKAIEDLNAWIESFGEPVTLCCDAPEYDWSLLSNLFTEYGFPANLIRRPLSVNTPESQRGIEEYFETQPYAIRDPKLWDAHEMMYRPFAIRHHALWDARALAYGNGVNPLVMLAHCKMLGKAIFDTVDLPNQLHSKLVTRMHKCRGKLHSAYRFDEFKMLSDEAISKIETAYQRIDRICKAENDGKTVVLRGYSAGFMFRDDAMMLLNFVEADQLTEAMNAAEIPMPAPPAYASRLAQRLAEESTPLFGMYLNDTG